VTPPLSKPFEAVWLLILNWNGAKRLPVSLGSLNRVMDGTPFTLLVTDNGSVDGSLENVPVHFHRPHEILRNGENLGFAAGNNRGLEKAFAAGAQWVVLLNDDMAVREDYLAQLADAAKRHPRAGLLGGLILFQRDHDLINSAGLEPDAFFRTQDVGFETRLSDTPLHEREVPSLSGGALAISRALWETCGGFDEKFFAYFEDVDLCLRARAAGFLAVFVPSAVTFHEYGGSQSKGSVLRFRLLARNHLYVCAKHASPARVVPLVIFVFCYRLFFSPIKLAFAREWRRIVAEWKGTLEAVPYVLELLARRARP